jgi:hypothetical protein
MRLVEARFGVTFNAQVFVQRAQAGGWMWRSLLRDDFAMACDGGVRAARRRRSSSGMGGGQQTSLASPPSSHLTAAVGGFTVPQGRKGASFSMKPDEG